MEFVYILKDNDKTIIDVTKNYCEELKDYRKNESWINKNITLTVYEIEDGLAEKYKEYLILKNQHNVELNLNFDYLHFTKCLYKIEENINSRKIDLTNDFFIDTKTSTLKIDHDMHYKIDKYFIEESKQFYYVIYSIGIASQATNFGKHHFELLEKNGDIIYTEEYPIYTLLPDGTLLHCPDSK